MKRFELAFEPTVESFESFETTDRLFISGEKGYPHRYAEVTCVLTTNTKAREHTGGHSYFEVQQRKLETCRSDRLILSRQLRYRSHKSFVQVRRREEGTNMNFSIRGLGTEKERRVGDVFGILRARRELEKHGHSHGGVWANSWGFVDLGFLTHIQKREKEQSRLVRLLSVDRTEERHVFPCTISWRPEGRQRNIAPSHGAFERVVNTSKVWDRSSWEEKRRSKHEVMRPICEKNREREKLAQYSRQFGRPAEIQKASVCSR